MALSHALLPALLATLIAFGWWFVAASVLIASGWWYFRCTSVALAAALNTVKHRRARELPDKTALAAAVQSQSSSIRRDTGEKEVCLARPVQELLNASAPIPVAQRLQSSSILRETGEEQVCLARPVHELSNTSAPTPAAPRLSSSSSRDTVEEEACLENGGELGRVCFLVCPSRSRSMQTPAGMHVRSSRDCVLESRLQTVGDVCPLSLAWPTEQENRDCDALMALLTPQERAQLSQEPEQVRHRVFLTRFLRGKGDVAKGAEACQAMLAYRKEHAATIAACHEQFHPDPGTYDFACNLHSNAAPFPHRIVYRGGCDNCYASLIALRDLNIEGWIHWQPEAMVPFVISLCEQYARILHTESIAQHRMVKIVEVRDGLGCRIGNPLRMLGNFRTMIPILSMYPEMLHRFVLINTSDSMVRFNAVMQRLMKKLFKSWFPTFDENEFGRDEGKLRLIKIGDWEDVAEQLPPQTVLAWAQAVEPREPRIAAGLMVARGCGMIAGHTARWQMQSEDHPGKLAALYFSEGKVRRLATGAGSGTFTPPVDGTLVLVADNTVSWRKTMHQHLAINFADASSAP